MVPFLNLPIHGFTKHTLKLIYLTKKLLKFILLEKHNFLKIQFIKHFSIYKNIRNDSFQTLVIAKYIILFTHFIYLVLGSTNLTHMQLWDKEASELKETVYTWQ